ncbi:RadC family protein [Brevibacillus borstelensis]|uniref:RadC family protein n=1 Tax=Brevibacillus borstelensis TaxID=45462 RepID=UPI002E1FBD9F|nr:DNA repair protein RadC [Brevibacillus borstelensis]MED1872053.1 DNA repair protein RadC [Brevibacillus borstelensis]
METYKQTELKSLLADSLREKPGSYIIEEIFTRFPTTTELLHATVEELVSIKGIGTAKARQIISALKLAHMLCVPSRSPYTIRKPEDVYKLLASELGYLQKEHFICLLLNTKNDVISKEVISIGSLNASIVHPREVFRPAIKRSCASIICAHNHPSGNSEPSKEDIEITKNLIEAGSIIGIDVLDHVIIGHNRYFSFKEQGLLHHKERYL